jgi:hypothetical protein
MPRGYTAANAISNTPNDGPNITTFGPASPLTRRASTAFFTFTLARGQTAATVIPESELRAPHGRTAATAIASSLQCDIVYLGPTPPPKTVEQPPTQGHLALDQQHAADARILAMTMEMMKLGSRTQISQLQTAQIETFHPNVRDKVLQIRAILTASKAFFTFRRSHGSMLMRLPREIRDLVYRELWADSPPIHMSFPDIIVYPDHAQYISRKRSISENSQLCRTLPLAQRHFYPNFDSTPKYGLPKWLLTSRAILAEGTDQLRRRGVWCLPRGFDRLASSPNTCPLIYSHSTTASQPIAVYSPTGRTVISRDPYVFLCLESMDNHAPPKLNFMGSSVISSHLDAIRHQGTTNTLIIQLNASFRLRDDTFMYPRQLVYREGMYDDKALKVDLWFMNWLKIGFGFVNLRLLHFEFWIADLPASLREHVYASIETEMDSIMDAASGKPFLKIRSSRDGELHLHSYEDPPTLEFRR